MSLGETVRAVLVHLLTPIAGLGFYFWLCRKMNKEIVPSPPFVDYFILFFTLGGWLMVALTVLLWRPSGMFLIGLFYLVFIAPLATAGLAFSGRKTRELSVYHRRAHQISKVYSVAMVVVIAVWFFARFAYQR
jgi:hypothetical protein